MQNSEKVKFISNWIKSYVDSMPTKAESLVIGISGGIDSSVSSTLSAMTGLKTIVLSMPIKQKSHQHDLSLKHQEWLIKKFKNVEAHTINLDELFLAFNASLSKFDNEHGMANSRARLRMTTLYQVAAANKGIVVGTGNKVEDFGVGFYTKYGDGGVDISPIADCNKTQVWELGKELGILQEIIDAPPTDGLWDDGRTDEGQLGLRYNELEEAMENPNSPNRVKYENIRKQIYNLSIFLSYEFRYFFNK
jgi:NAD+ synthase